MHRSDETGGRTSASKARGDNAAALRKSSLRHRLVRLVCKTRLSRSTTALTATFFQQILSWYLARKLDAASCLFPSFLLGVFWFTPGNYAWEMLFCGLLAQATGLQVAARQRHAGHSWTETRRPVWTVCGDDISIRKSLYPDWNCEYGSVGGQIWDQYGRMLGHCGFCSTAVFLIISVTVDGADKIDEKTRMKEA